jgi:hypothetical protein
MPLGFTPRTLYRSEKGIPLKYYGTMAIHHAMSHAADRWRRWQHEHSWPTDHSGESLDVADVQPDLEHSDRMDAEAMLASIPDRLPARLFAVLSFRFAEVMMLAAIGERCGFSQQYAGQLVARRQVLARRPA